MKKAIICHGVSPSFESNAENDFPGCSRSWLGWLQQRYIIAGVNCQNPCFPNSWRPARKYPDDVNVFSRLELDADTRLVGHSCGAGFLLKYLGENPELKARHLVLVAPWIGFGEPLNYYFENLELDPDLPNRINRIDLFYSTNDIAGVQESVKKIMEIYPNINMHNMGDKGHLRADDFGTHEFPELWEVCKSEI
ncbi:MAG: hypothetical protein FWG80_02490 [Alphaproteobacteria bacterium]|nr:hypothetical protein [Alphaproteobacteria bacterium]